MQITTPGSGGDVATDAIFDALGDLPVGTGANTAARLAVGANGTVLTADSGEATGLKWSAVAGTGDVTAASTFDVDNTIIRSDGTAKGVQKTSWVIADTDEMSVTVDGVEEIGISVTSSGADSNAYKGLATGLGSTALNGVNTTAAGVGVKGETQVSGGVGLIASTTQAGGTAFQVWNSAGFKASIDNSGTADRAITIPDAAGAIVLGSYNAQYNAAGDLLYGSADNTGSRLAIGTALQLLQTNAGATAPEWTSTIAPATVNATTANITTLKILDSIDQSHGLSLVVGSNLTADRTLTFTTGDANRTVTIQGDVTLPAGTALVSGGALGTPSSGTLTNCTIPASAIAAGTTAAAITLGENSPIILDSVLSADGQYSGLTIPGTAGATLAFGDAIYLDPTDSRWELTDANAAAGADGDCRGLVGVCVLAAAADGDPTRILTHGTVRADAAFPTFTVGAAVYFSETAGDLTSTAPTTTDSVSRVIGWSVDGNSVYVAPSGFWTTHT